MWDYLAAIGTVGVVISAPGILFSHALSRKLVPFLIRKFPGYAPRLTKYTNQQDFMKAAMRLSNVTAGFNYIYNIQLGFDTNQPSKLVSQSILIATSIAQLISPMNLLLRALGFVGLGFWQAGSQNDIENYNHMGYRREFRMTSPSRLFSKEALRYIADDTRYTLSLKPWKALMANASDRDTWTQPNSSITALSGQMNFLIGFTALGTLLLPLLPSIRKTVMGRLIPPLSFVTTLVGSVPGISRAWESKDESDGAFTLIGAPLNAVGRMFVMSSPDRMHLAGLTGIGGGFFGLLGSNWTGQKHDYLISYLESLHRLAQRYPDFNAKDVEVYLMTHPQDFAHLKHKMGKQRIAFLLETLAEGEMMRRKGVSFKVFLEPVISSHNAHHGPIKHQHNKVAALA